MKAVIIAAGKGTRINTDTSEVKPKPLYKAGDDYIIGHVIKHLAKGGVTHVYVIVGFMKEKMMDALGDGSQYGVKISYVVNPDIEKANGFSAYQAKGFLHEPFILCMSDHIFNPSVVRDFVNFVRGKNQSYLAVDKRISNVFDIQDATKVLADGNDAIKKIHKRLTEFNCVDTGMFYFTPEYFEALESSMGKGDYTQTGGTQELANRGKMFVWDIGDRPWMEIDNREDLAEFERKQEQLVSEDL